MKRHVIEVVIGGCLLLPGAVALAFAAAGQDAAGLSLKATLEKCRTDLQAFDEALAAGEEAVDGLAEMVHDKSLAPLHRYAAANVLGDIGSRKAVKPLLAALKDPDQGVRRCAAAALGKIGDPAARPALMALANNDPFAWRDPATGKMRYLVREDARKALEMLSGPNPATSRPGTAGASAPALAIPEVEAKYERLPWPHQAPRLSPAEIQKLNRDVWVINDFSLYQANERGDFAYLHGGLDIVLENGARIYAMKDGWVKSTSNSTVTIADHRDGKPGFGWEYTHLGKIQVQPGQFVKRGTWIGEVEFHGLPHVHLTKVYSQGDSWGNWRYMCMPNGHFEYTDTQPPVIRKPFHFLRNNMDTQVQPGPDGRVVLSGKVDIVVAMREQGEYAHSKENSFGDRLGVSRIEWEVRPAGRQGSEARKFSSFDFEHMAFKSGVFDRAFNAALAKTVYKHASAFEPERSSGDKTLSYYVITNCPQTGDHRELRPEWADACWDTGAADNNGRPLFPDGKYEVTVRAWDFRGRQSAAVMEMIIRNN